MNKIMSVRIIVNMCDLKRIKSSFKKNFNNINLSLGILKGLPFLEEDTKNRIENGLLPQPGKIFETMVTQQIANILECKYVGNGWYRGKDYSLYQDGGSNKSDLTLYDHLNGMTYGIEIKESLSYVKTCGFTYDDKGGILECTSRDLVFNNFVKSLFDGGVLSDYNILDNLGVNKKYELNDGINAITTTKFDYIISHNGDGVLNVMTIDEYNSNHSFLIEVRSCSRNTKKVFTPNKLDIIDDFLYLNIDEVSEMKQRGGNKSSRYKYITKNTTFSFKKNNIEMLGNNNFRIHISNVKQHLGDVSIIQKPLFV
jgi:hypothetical protein